MLRSRSKGCRNERWVKLVGLQETYAPAATAFLLTSVIRVFCPHPELFSLNYRKSGNALKSISTQRTFSMPDPFLMLRSRSKGCRNKRWVKLVRLQETYAPAAIAFLLTSVIRVFHPHPELYNLNDWKGQNALTFLYKKGRRAKNLFGHNKI